MRSRCPSSALTKALSRTAIAGTSVSANRSAQARWTRTADGSRVPMLQGLEHSPRYNSASARTPSITGSTEAVPGQGRRSSPDSPAGGGYSHLGAAGRRDRSRSKGRPMPLDVAPHQGLVRAFHQAHGSGFGPNEGYKEGWQDGRYLSVPAPDRGCAEYRPGEVRCWWEGARLSRALRGKGLCPVGWVKAEIRDLQQGALGACMPSRIASVRPRNGMA